VLENCTRQRPAAYAQEPQYNTQDSVFLSTLGIQKIDDPKGFNLLTNHSFAYIPGAEQHVTFETLVAGPFLCLTGELDRSPGAYPFFQPRSISPGDPVYRPQDTDRHADPNTVSCQETGELIDATRDDSAAKIDEARVGNRQASPLPDDQDVIEWFLRDKEAAKVPDFDLQDRPVYNTWLYWPRQSN
jgi:hypothetical protein